MRPETKRGTRLSLPKGHVRVKTGILKRSSSFSSSLLSLVFIQKTDRRYPYFLIVMAFYRLYSAGENGTLLYFKRVVLGRGLEPLSLSAQDP